MLLSAELREQVQGIEASTSGAHGRTDVSEMAGDQADKYCAKRGSRAELIHVTFGTRFAAPQQVTVIFRCVSRSPSDALVR